MKSIIEDWSSKRPVGEVLEIMAEAGVPAAPVLNIQEIAESDHIDARNILIDIEHPKAGKTRIPIMPVKFSETPACVERPSPLLG
jgi:CoA:oxalate CoA-transferase